MTKKNMRRYAAQKAAITRKFNSDLLKSVTNFKFASVGALKAVRTRKLNALNAMFGVS